MDKATELLIQTILSEQTLMKEDIKKILAWKYQLIGGGMVVATIVSFSVTLILHFFK